MARAAVLPPSPAKRGARTAVMKSGAAGSKGKSTAAKKGAGKAAAAARTPVISDDDTDDELGMMMEEPAPKPVSKPVKPRGRPPAGPAAKAATSTRGKKTASTPAPAPTTEDSNDESEKETKPEPPKKRVGRPRKNPVPEEAAGKPDPAPTPKPRGRPKGSGTKSTTTTRKTTRKAAEAETATENDEPKHFTIATNSTTMRSNILRGPAKKKTVTFQDVSESEGDDAEEPVAAAAGRRKAPARNTGAGAGKAGLGATPVRKAATTGGRGRKPAAKKGAAQPLSPKKDKQVAKSLSAYASSDGEEDELSATKDDFKSPVKLVVHSPAKPSEHIGLSSPVRKVNFTPKKASNLIDENGEPKLPTPKHGSTGLSSPVRKINFTPNRSHHTVADNGHLALPPGKSIDFSDSVFMSSPARRPEASPFQFTLRGTPHKGLAKSIPAPNFTPGEPSPLKASPKKGHLGASFPGSPSKSLPAPEFTTGQHSPLKASPKKGHLGASFSGSPSKSTPAFPARSSLFQSPAKRHASPFKSTLFFPKIGNEGTPQPWRSPPKATSVEDTVDQDLEMVEEVARDIFGIEINSDNSKTSSESSLSTEVLEPQVVVDVDPVDVEQDDATAPEAGDTDEKLRQLEDEVRREPDDMGTICFSTMEELQEPFQNLERLNHGDDEVEMHEFDEDMNDGDDADDAVQMDGLDCHETVFDERAPEPESALDFAELVDTEQQDQQSPLPKVPCSPSEPTLSLNVLEKAQSLASAHGAAEDVVQEDVEHADYLRPYDEEEAESEEDVDNDEPTFVPSEATFTTSSQPRSPYALSEADGNSPPRLSVPPLVPTPPVRETAPVEEMPPKSPGNLGSAKSIDRLFDINYEGRAEVEEDSYFETTQSEIPTPKAPRASETPHSRAQRKSVGVDLGFTPLAQQFGGWDTTTPSQDRPTRPRRRGVFSLVGPLDNSTAAKGSTQDAGDVSYPDLSRASLANTPRLFAELPQFPESDRVSMASPSRSRSQSPLTEQDQEVEMDSPARSEIFEDTEPTMPETDQAPLREASTPQTLEDEEEDLSDEDKENSDTPSFVPPTTPIRLVSEQRTVHTVSKVPLKAEGEVSPLKLPRKRGFSLSHASPTRFSPRARQSPRAGSPTSPHKAARIERSPSPKRRCSTTRRSSVKMPDITPKSPSVAPSPSKTPRRPNQQALRGAVVHVDVHTTEGEDASGIFVELLQQMGARCVKTWSWNPRSSMSPVDGQDPTNAKVGITHVVYKDGGLRTLEKVKYAAGLVKCVGVGWVLDCERENKWLDETPYTVDSSIIPRGGAKRRKSMEPRALSNVNGTLVRTAEPSTPSASGRRCGADWGAMESFRKITPPIQAPATPEQSTGDKPTGDRYNIPQTPGYNFANLDAIGMSPATPYFLSSRAQLVQQSCPPKQSQQGLFPTKPKPMSSLFEDDDEDERKKQRARMEAARRKTFFKPAVGSPLGR